MKNYMLIKFILIVFVTLIFGFSSYSQPFGGGIYLGGNFSQIDGDRFSGYNLPGLYGGGYVNLDLTPKIKAQFELSYIRKGAGNQFDETNTTFYKVKLDYIEAPILINYQIKKRFSVHAGIAYALLFKQTEDLDGAGDLEPIPLFNNYDFSFLAGFEFKIFEKLLINSRYNHSILAIRSHPGDQTYFLNRGQYNNFINLSLRYIIK